MKHRLSDRGDANADKAAGGLGRIGRIVGQGGVEVGVVGVQITGEKETLSSQARASRKSTRI